MAVEQTSFFCPVCQQQRLFTRQKGVNHILHLLVTLFTCGLWAFVWLLLTVSDNPRYHCSQCGHSDATNYLANPYLRSQEAQQNAERVALRGETSSPFNSITEWFSGLSNGGRALVIGGAVFGVVFVIFLIADIQRDNARRRSNPQANAANNANVLDNRAASATPTVPAPSTLSSSENLERGKKALSDGELSTARIHLSAIPKDAKEFASAKQYLATLERREKRKGVEGELAEVRRDLAGVENMLDATEDFGPQAGSPKKAIYMNALKRKGELQLRRIQLERKLKSMP